LLISVIVFLRYFYKANLLSPQIDYKIAIVDLKLGLPLIILNASVFVFDVSDRFFLEQMTNLNETGIYGAAYTYSSVVILIGNGLIGAIRTRIFAQLSVNNFNLSKLLYLYLMIIIFVCFCVILGTDFVFHNLIDRKYIKGSSLIITMIFGFFFWSLYIYFNSVLIYYNRNYLIALISLIGIVVNLSLNYFLIKQFGVIGASFSTIFSCITMTLLTFIFYLKYLKINRSKIDNL
ncbi:MAG: lipopolysaccharide biosynthesis protein, partial [Flavobacteriia bacterium]